MEPPSLYSRLGGYDAIAAITDALLARLRTDPQLGGFWQGHGADSRRRERQLMVNYLCTAAGGPVFYTGRNMQTAHKGLGISTGDWEVFMQHATAVLEHFAVPAPERDEVLTFLTGLRDDVVERT